MENCKSNIETKQGIAKNLPVGSVSSVASFSWVAVIAGSVVGPNG